jgi:hypothetical protein
VDPIDDAVTEADPEQRYREVRERVLAAGTPRPGATETASFLVDQTKASFDRTLANATNVESKATVLLGIVAAAATALGLFGAHGGSGLFATPIGGLAGILVVLSMIALLCALPARELTGPNLDPYVSPAMVREDNRIGLALALAEHYGTMQARVRAQIRRDRRILLTAYLAVGAAAVLLVLNAAGDHYGRLSHRVPRSAPLSVPSR